jgi:hypothetical protein
MPQHHEAKHYDYIEFTSVGNTAHILQYMPLAVHWHAQLSAADAAALHGRPQIIKESPTPLLTHA